MPACQMFTKLEQSIGSDYCCNFFHLSRKKTWSVVEAVRLGTDKNERENESVMGDGVRMGSMYINRIDQWLRTFNIQEIYRIIQRWYLKLKSIFENGF